MLAGDLDVDETFTPAVGQSFVIIDNDGNDAVIGTFAGLAEGAIIDSDFNGAGLAAAITYVGGDGNDVAITILPPITAEDDTAMVDEDDGPVFINVLGQRQYYRRRWTNDHGPHSGDVCRRRDSDAVWRRVQLRSAC